MLLLLLSIELCYKQQINLPIKPAPENEKSIIVQILCDGFYLLASLIYTLFRMSWFHVNLTVSSLIANEVKVEIWLIFDRFNFFRNYYNLFQAIESKFTREYKEVFL